MTHRTEKPSQHESSTDTLISALGKIAKQLEENDYAASLALLEAAARLDKLEKELHFTREVARSEAEFADELNEKLKAQQLKTQRDEFAMQALNGLIGQCKTEDDYQRVSSVAYLLADAMMEARK